MPTEGSRTQIFLDIAGGDNEYFRLGFNHRHYFSPWRDVVSGDSWLKQHVFMVGARAETIDGFGSNDDVPIYNRMFLGGPKSIRGIEYRYVSPYIKETRGGDYIPWGGQTLFCMNFEYTVPIVKMVRFAMFSDLGSVGEDDFDLDFSDNELTISRKSGNVFNNTPKITLHITTPHIQNIIMSGTSDIEFKTDYEIEAPFNITMSGTGDIDIKALKCESTDIKISGTGDLKAKKITCKTSADILVSGTGDINASIKANSISAKVSGVGDADLDVDCNNLFASASGVGDMELKGKCINYKKHESGKSSIDSRGLTYKEKK
jgi:hypothetical protein